MIRSAVVVAAALAVTLVPAIWHYQHRVDELQATSDLS